MNLKTSLFVAISLGLSPAVMADSNEAVAPSGHNPWTVEASLLYLFSHGNTTTDFDYVDQSYEEGMRLSLGYQPCPDSFGYRLSYTYYKGTTLGDAEENGPRLDVIDFEMIKHFEALGCEGNYTFGIRYIDLYERYDVADVRYKGFGPTVGVEMEHPISGPYSLFLDTQASLTFGDDDMGEVNDSMFMCQAAVGIKRDLNLFGYDGYAKLGYEHQYYHNATYDNGDAEINGLTLTIGCEF